MLVYAMLHVNTTYCPFKTTALEERLSVAQGICVLEQLADAEGRLAVEIVSHQELHDLVARERELEVVVEVGIAPRADPGTVDLEGEVERLARELPGEGADDLARGGELDVDPV